MALVSSQMNLTFLWRWLEFAKIKTLYNSGTVKSFKSLSKLCSHTLLKFCFAPGWCQASGGDIHVPWKDNDSRSHTFALRKPAQVGRWQATLPRRHCAVPEQISSASSPWSIGPSGKCYFPQAGVSLGISAPYATVSWGYILSAKNIIPTECKGPITNINGHTLIK